MELRRVSGSGLSQFATLIARPYLCIAADCESFIGAALLMYVIFLDHYLGTEGAVVIERGPARKLADFATTVVAYASCAATDLLQVPQSQG